MARISEDEVRDIIVDTGSLDYSRQFAGNHIKSAKKVIDSIQEMNVDLELLKDLADYMLARTY